MKLNFKLVLAALSLSLALKSQNLPENTRITKRGCGTSAPSPEWDAWFNKKVQEFKENKAAGKTQNTSLTIPVIVHVIHNGNPVGTFPNLSATQIRSQIDVLNKDFAGIGLNSNKLASTGFSVVGAANTNITFCLAQLDPNGAPLAEPGIERLHYNTFSATNPNAPTSTAAFQAYFDNTVKPASIWDPTLYLNIWISDVNANAELLGYATFPGGTSLSGIPSSGTASNDGVWIWAKSFGNVGSFSTLSAPYNQGRTATHEIGHWLGLRHIGGDPTNPNGDCNATDYCDDTPSQKGGFWGGGNGQNFGSPTYPINVNVCASPYGDMFMNFMDYTDDAILYMFTPDQNDRIQTAMQEGYFRNQLSASSSTLCVGLPIADFMINDMGFNVACANSDSPITNQTAATPAATYSWSAVPSSGVVFLPSSTDANPTVNFPAIGEYTVSMIATNSVGVTSTTVAIQAEKCTGIKENRLNESTKIAPNPSTGKISISAPLFAGRDIQVYVHNALGQLLVFKEYTNNGTTPLVIDLDQAPEGVYTVSISNGAEKVVKRLILKK